MDGFPWSSWAGSLNLFVWFVVGAYLIWGCRPRFRLLGLGVMPLAVVLFVVARLEGGTAAGSKPHYSNLFLVLHVGFVLAAFAGFTLAAALAALYLWEERRLKLRAAGHPPPPPAAARLARAAVPADDRSVAAAADARARRRDSCGCARRVRASTRSTCWRSAHGSSTARSSSTRPAGRRAAYLALGGFALVAVARLALARSHFA